MRSCHSKIFIIIICLIALALGVLSVTFNPKALTAVVIISRFFEVMIPFLGVMALLKYLFCYTSGCSSSGCCSKEGGCGCASKCCSKEAKSCSTEHGQKHHH